MDCLCANSDYCVVYTLKSPTLEQIVRCLSCGLYRTQPAPVNGNLKALSYTSMEDEPEILRKRRRRAHKKITSVIARETAATSGIKILDIGCSVGYFVKYAKDKGFNCFGLDINTGSIEYARRDLNLSSLCIAEADALPFGKDVFEAIVLSHVLEHLANPPECLRQIRRVLKPGGILLVIVPHHRGLIARLRPLSWLGWSPQTHYWHFTPEVIIQLLKEAGLKQSDLN